MLPPIELVMQQVTEGPSNANHGAGGVDKHPDRSSGQSDDVERQILWAWHRAERRRTRRVMRMRRNDAAANSKEVDLEGYGEQSISIDAIETGE